MKKSIASTALSLTALSLAMASAHVQADEYVDIYDYDQTPSIESSAQATGLSVGAIIGAFLAGPPGAFVGGAGGSLLVESTEQKQQISALQAQLETTRTNLATLQHKNRQLTAQVQQVEQQRLQLTSIKSVQPALRLGDVLSNGFSFAVQFRTNSHRLEKHFAKQLTELAHAFVAIDDLHVRVSGHADRRGTEDDNQRLSAQRANQVIKVLREAGWPASRMQMNALGETRPLTNANDRSGYDFDRRVIISFGAKGAGI